MRSRLGVIVLSHGVVDFFSALVIPIMSVLEGRASMTPAQGAVLIAAGSLASGLIQPIVSLIGDRHDTRSLGTVGLVVAALAIGLIGYADSFWMLLALQVIGTAGVGAFHPPAAAVMGHLAGRRRGLGVSIFFAAGILGGALGSFTAPIWARTLGIETFLVGLIPAGVTAALLAWATHTSEHRHADARTAHPALPERERAARWAAVWVLYVSNALRFIVNMAMVQVLIRWSELHVLERDGGGLEVASALSPALKAEMLTPEARLLSSEVNGPLQAGMQLGMGVFGLALGALVPARRSRLAMVLTPCVGAAGVALMPWSESAAVAFLLCVVVGGGYAGTMPASIAAAQRLLPHRTTLASGLMMGGAWALACVGPPLAQWMYDLRLLEGRANLGVVGAVFAGVLAASGLLVLLIPRRLIDGLGEAGGG